MVVEVGDFIVWRDVISAGSCRIWICGCAEETGKSADEQCDVRAQSLSSVAMSILQVGHYLYTVAVSCVERTVHRVSWVTFLQVSSVL